MYGSNEEVPWTTGEVGYVTRTGVLKCEDEEDLERISSGWAVGVTDPLRGRVIRWRGRGEKTSWGPTDLSRAGSDGKRRDVWETGPSCPWSGQKECRHRGLGVGLTGCVYESSANDLLV